MNPVSPKVAWSTVAAAGAGFVVAVVTGEDWQDELAELEPYVSGLVTAALTFFAGWVRRDPLRDTGQNPPPGDGGQPVV